VTRGKTERPKWLSARAPGQCAVRLVAGLVAASAVVSPSLAAPTSATAANESIYQKPVSSKLNSTGRAINMPVPLKEDGNALGEIIVRIDPDDSVLVPKVMLIEKLTPALDKASLERLHGTRDVNGQVSINDLKAAGFNVVFDPNALELKFLPTADQRPVGDLSLARRGSPQASSAAAKPAMMAGYLNVIAGADHVWANDIRPDDKTSARLDLQGVFRMWNIVFENEMTYEGEVDANTCPVGAKCVYDHTSGLKRRRTRLVYDLPDQLLRFQFGDADSWATGLQRSPDILGVSIEHSPRKLRPGENIRPTGKSSFRLERPADVEVVINGAIVQRLRLRPGNYNLSDLPLATGANEVQLIISDDTGDRRTLAFTTFFDGNLLGAGKSEWSASAGLPSYFRDNERQYRDDMVFATGFYRYGLTDQITAEAHAQGDNNVIMGGGGLFTATPWGFWGGQAALSQSQNGGTGYAVNINWDLINFNGLVGGAFNTRETLRLAAEYRSTQFRTPGEFLTTASGILYPQFNYWLRLTGSYSVPIAWGVTATASVRYQFSDDKQVSLSPYTIKGDRYGADLTLSAPLSSWASGSVTVGYSNESTLRYFSNPNSENEADFRVMARLYIRPEEKTRITASYDSQNKSTYVSAYRGDGRGLDRWETSVDVQHTGIDDRANVGASASYYANRAEVNVAHTSGFNNIGNGKFNTGDADQRTSARVGTSLAFADGKFGVGQPIRGNGFAVVYPHESIQGKEITVGTGEDVRARANGWGNAVVADVPAYSPSSIPIDVADLPVGYSLGAGAFDTFAPYRGGYALEVGSAYAVSAYGTLLKTDGEPVALLTGTATPSDNPAKQVAIFTNGAGKFGAEGLAPGKWIIEMATDGVPTRYEIEVPKGTDGLFKAGTLKPAKG
jgi:outer membrane usher protein